MRAELLLLNKAELPNFQTSRLELPQLFALSLVYHRFTCNTFSNSSNLD
jgi:hypothetical protein